MKTVTFKPEGRNTMTLTYTRGEVDTKQGIYAIRVDMDEEFLARAIVAFENGYYKRVVVGSDYIILLLRIADILVIDEA